jgi:DNA (cytosine-5)-methyltransferase 1
MGWENIFHCEINPFCQKILNYYWPNSISYDDIKKTDFRTHRWKIDVLSGGFPCQPYSVAGKKKGKEDDRHLWPEMLRAIREIQPGWVVGENVRGLISWNGGMVFEEVQTDLEAEGYEVTSFLLPACGVNAPHRRDRIWFVAHAIGARAGGKGGEACNERGRTSEKKRERIWGNNRGISEQGIITDPTGFGFQGGSASGELRSEWPGRK